ncbi:MAG: hypothetical protein RMI83_01610 [Desulfurococcaceae archaeon]|nr:hypothetical protein [Sulfolobales archaeon]MDW8169785.1 hypothetical protein [Desulfurococcaceae archaeon]
MDIVAAIVNSLTKVITEVITDIIAAIPAVMLFIIIVLAGYLIGSIVKRVVKFIFNRAVWSFLKKTVIGQRIEEAGIDLGGVLSSVVMAIIIALSFLLAINASGFPGPATAFINTFINTLIGILGGIIVLVVGIPLAALAAEYIAKLIALPLSEKEGFTNLVRIIVQVLLILFVFGLAIALMFSATALLNALTAALPAAFIAATIIIVGYVISDMVGGLMKKVVATIFKPLEITDVGIALKSADIDISALIGGLVKASIIVIAITIGFSLIGVTGVAADILSTIVYYLPKILAAIALLTLGLALVVVLARYIGKVFKVVTKEKFAPLGDLAENLIAVGLIAVFITIALNILGLYGDFIYSLILGVLVIAAGIMIVDVITRILKESHATYERMVPIIGTVIVFVFAYVGVSTILSQIPGALEILRVIGWGVAVAFSLALIPVVFYLVKVAWRETS